MNIAIGFSLTMTIMWEGAKGFPVQAREVRGSRKARGGAGYGNKILLNTHNMQKKY